MGVHPGRPAIRRRLGQLGWSMGGYGALRLVAQLGPERVLAVSAVSPALWTDPDDASEEGFEDSAAYQGRPDQHVRAGWA